MGCSLAILGLSLSNHLVFLDVLATYQQSLGIPKPTCTVNMEPETCHLPHLA